ncbi:MAG: glycosyltransferase family 2 protein [Patescibacteria group bacterium]|nr:glycosyltransferase family 2 protein [Patescibacteria group bacterium]
MKLTVITINYNTPEMTERVIRNFFAMEKDLEFEMILIDNNSDKKVSRAIINEFNLKFIQNSKNLGFAKAVNQGIGESRGDYVLLLNSDVFIEKKAISRMIEYAQACPEAGIMGPRMLYPDKSFQASFGRFPTLWREFLRFSLLYRILPGATVTVNTIFKQIKITEAQEADWLSGGCMLIRRGLIDELGLFDEKYFFGMEDFDFCFRAQQIGYKAIYYPFCPAIHYHGHSSGGLRNAKRFKYDKLGMQYFLKKNFPNKFITRFFINLMYDFKISIANLLKL